MAPIYSISHPNRLAPIYSIPHPNRLAPIYGKSVLQDFPDLVEGADGELWAEVAGER